MNKSYKTYLGLMLPPGGKLTADLANLAGQSIFVQCLCLKGIVKNDYVTGIGGAVV
jgi:hypothetical protein